MIVVNIYLKMRIIKWHLHCYILFNYADYYLIADSVYLHVNKCLCLRSSLVNFLGLTIRNCWSFFPP